MTQRFTKLIGGQLQARATRNCTGHECCRQRHAPADLFVPKFSVDHGDVLLHPQYQHLHSTELSGDWTQQAAARDLARFQRSCGHRPHTQRQLARAGLQELPVELRNAHCSRNALEGGRHVCQVPKAVARAHNFLLAPVLNGSFGTFLTHRLLHAAPGQTEATAPNEIHVIARISILCTRQQSRQEKMIEEDTQAQATAAAAVYQPR